MSLRSQEGATAVEYGIMVALIAVVIIAAVTVLGGNTCSGFKAAADGVGNASPVGAPAPADACG